MEEQKVVVGVLDAPHEVQNVLADLQNIGIDRNNIDIMDHKECSRLQESADTEAGAPKGIFSGLMNWVRDFGIHDKESEIIAECVRRGGSMVAVKSPNDLVETVSDILSRHGAVDIDQRADFYRKSGFQKFDEASPAFTRDEMIAERERFAPGGEFAIPVIEENVKVGKKMIPHSRIRIISRVTEQPITQDISLRQEHVEVERRATDRALNSGDINAFKEGTVELTESEEVPVVTKEARVKEEVIVKRDVEEHIETVHDTALRRDVVVERVDEKNSSTRNPS